MDTIAAIRMIQIGLRRRTRMIYRIDAVEGSVEGWIIIDIHPCRVGLPTAEAERLVLANVLGIGVAMLPHTVPRHGAERRRLLEMSFELPPVPDEDETPWS